MHFNSWYDENKGGNDNKLLIMITNFKFEIIDYEMTRPLPRV